MITVLGWGLSIHDRAANDLGWEKGEVARALSGRMMVTTQQEALRYSRGTPPAGLAATDPA